MDPMNESLYALSLTGKQLNKTPELVKTGKQE
jgi:hypothetical protein